MKCARCHRRIKGAFTWHMGHPFGPVCARLMALKPGKNDRAAKAVRDDRTKDMFEVPAWTA